MKLHYLAPLLLGTGILAVHAQPAYRAVDEQGNVTFSDTPVPGAVEETRISIDAPTPTPAEVEESKRKAAELLDAASQTSPPTTTSEPAPGQAEQRQAAQQALQEAEQQLEEARQVGPGDRIGTASGGSRLTPQYLKRVQAAEEKVERARRQLEATK